MYYFKKWRGDLGPQDGEIFMSNLMHEGEKQIKLLEELLKKYEKDNSIKKLL